MTKLIAIGALLCATVLLGECVDVEKPTLTRQIIITMPKSTTVRMGEQLYTVSMTQTSVHVNSTDANHKPCELTIDPAKDSIEGPMNVADYGDMLYILGKHASEKVGEQDKEKYALLMINTRDCSLKTADVPLVGTPNSEPSLVAQSTGVDLFFPKMETCAPCKFSNDGARVDESVPQIPPSSSDADEYPYYDDFEKFGPNYMYFQNLEGDKAVLKVFDGTNLNVLKEKELDYQVDSLTNTKTGYMAVCSKKYDSMMADIAAYKEVNCERTNTALESLVPVKIPIEPHSEPISSVSYSHDSETGNSYIGFAKDQNLHVYVHDGEGKLVKSYDMGKIDERFEKYEHQPMFYSPYSHWDVSGFIVGKEYCLVTEQVSDMDKHEVDLHDIRCINLVK